MPAPVVVYVLAIIGTVGAAIAFKEFVYDPHIAPAIDRWNTEYQSAREARRRRQHIVILQDGDDMQMSETRKRGTVGDNYSDDESSDDGNEDQGKTAATSSHSVMRDGLLIKQPVSESEVKSGADLENFVAREVNEWRNHLTGHVLRQRKNVSEYAVDESLQPIPYTPLSPTRTHVIIDSSAPSPSTSAHSRLPTPSPEANTLQSNSGLPIVVSPNNELRNVDKIGQATPAAPKHTSPLRSILHPLQQVDHEDPLPTPVSSISSGGPPSAPSPSIKSALHAHTQSYTQLVPSLSQSYPQELDYEHDLELLSPPSSRAESPFFMATRSPPHVNGRPTSTLGSPSTSDLSFAAISPRSPLRMGLGNDSYDAISPVPDFQTLSGSRVTGPPAHLRPDSSAGASASGEHSSEPPTPSSQASAYLSFDDSDTEDGPIAQPYAHLTGPGMSTSIISSSSPLQPAALNVSLAQAPYHTNPTPPNMTRTDAAHPTAAVRTVSASPLNPASSGSFSAEHGPSGLLLSTTPTLFPVPPRAPYTPSPLARPEGVSVASNTANASVALPAGGRDPAYFRPSSHTQAHDASDSELSDLDFISDYAPSESDMGNESDASWGVLGRR